MEKKAGVRFFIECIKKMADLLLNSETERYMANIISDETIEYVGILAKLELSEEEKENAKDDRSKDSQWMNAYKKAAIIGLAIALAVIVLLKGLSKVKEHLAK